MTERVYTTVDKTDWGPGEWQSEPDKVQWKDEETSYPCLAKRGPGGHWCGYVGVPPGHPAHGLDYDAVRDLFPGWGEDGYLEVHGGLTYAGECQKGPEETSICHIPDPGEPDNVWWLGFDCAHSGDLVPKYGGEFRAAHGESYKPLTYVRAETARLARQLLSMAGEGAVA